MNLILIKTLESRDMDAITNNLSKLIEIERAKRVLVSGQKINISEIMQDIANFCKINIETVKAYKRGRALPSLPLALKVSEYFHMSVNDIFTIADYEEAIKRISNKGRPPRGMDRKSQEIKLCQCGNIAVAKNLCMKHYQKQRRITKEATH